MAITRLPSFEPTPLKYPVPEGFECECGYLTVPEFHYPIEGEANKDRSIRLYVTKVKSLSKNPLPEPNVFLYGGPGGNSKGILERLEQLKDYFLADRDFIIFDQRGTGFSEPMLDCPEMAKRMVELLGEPLGGEQRARELVKAALECRERLVSSGIDVRAYNTLESAADVNDLCIALGYPKVNLYGISYGTRLGLAVVRDFPEKLRSVILDSNVPIQVCQFTEARKHTAHSFNLLFQRVAQDSKARVMYPDLHKVYASLFKRLNETPVTLSIPKTDTSGGFDFFLNGEILAGIFYFGFYGRDQIPYLPRMIWEIDHGGYDTISKFISNAFSLDETGGEGTGMYFSVTLFDDKVLPDIRAQIRQDLADHPEIGWLPYTEPHMGEYIVDLSEGWKARKPRKEEYQAVVSDVPALVLAGEFDQNTPAVWSRIAAETLSHGYYMEFPNIGHGVISWGEIALKIMKEFFDDPTRQPNTHYLEQLPPLEFV
jgi:pimeloyl-ACP methyl ester carboxylesterase